MNVYFHAGKDPYSTRPEAVMIGGVAQPDTAHTVNTTRRRGRTVAPQIAPPELSISGAVRSMRHGYRAGLCLPSARPGIFEDHAGETGGALARRKRGCPLDGEASGAPTPPVAQIMAASHRLPVTPDGPNDAPSSCHPFAA